MTKREIKVHAKRLSPFYYNPDEVDPEDIAFRDKDEYVVEAIVDHSGIKGRPRASYDFKVRWQGYSEEWDQWLPYEELKDNNQLHLYLWEHGLKSFLSKAQIKEVQEALKAENG